MQTRTTSLSGLLPYTQYPVVVVAVNSAGHALSAVVEVTTLEATPGPVDNVTFVESTDGSFALSWAPPARPNGVILGYFVSWSVAGSAALLDELDAGTNTSAVVTGLVKDTTYVAASLFVRSDVFVNVSHHCKLTCFGTNRTQAGSFLCVFTHPFATASPCFVVVVCLFVCA
jgi:hypothetical protein